MHNFVFRDNVIGFNTFHAPWGRFGYTTLQFDQGVVIKLRFAPWAPWQWLIQARGLGWYQSSFCQFWTMLWCQPLLSFIGLFIGHKENDKNYVYLKFFLKNGPFLASFCLFSFFSYNFNTNWKKRRWCAWDLNPGPQDGRRRRNHWAMAATNVYFKLNEQKQFSYIRLMACQIGQWLDWQAHLGRQHPCRHPSDMR